MQIYLPIAEMSVPIEMLLSLGGVVGFLSGLFGVGGGFLATPMLIFLGIPPAVAVGTQANQLIASSLSGALAHLRRGNVDIRIGTVMLVGGLIGTIVGMGLFKLLEHFGQIDIFISLSYVILLGGIGGLMFFDSVLSIVQSKSPKKKKKKTSLYHTAFFKNLPWKMRFPKSRLYVSALVPGGIGMLGGMLVSVLGIGGGFVIVPAMIYMLGMPVLLVAGTSLFQIVFTSAFATILHCMTSHTVDIVLAAFLILGSVVGVQMGVAFSRYINSTQARIVLAVIILVVCGNLVANLLMTPLDPYSIEVRR